MSKLFDWPVRSGLLLGDAKRSDLLRSLSIMETEGGFEMRREFYKSLLMNISQEGVTVREAVFPAELHKLYRSAFGGYL